MTRPAPPPPDPDRLDRLAREWFAEARVRSAADEKQARQEGQDRVARDDDGGMFDAMFGGDADCDGGD